MRFEGVELRNFRCYAESSVPFEAGVTVVHGPNGSGKSSLLDACFFALYGANTLDGTTLDEVITTGADEASVSLSFHHDGRAFHLLRELRVRGDRAQTATCELQTDAETITGARAVREAVARMLRMDADAFLNCAYVRQGEVNKLIHASPRERQDMIDELLQLGVLEEYRERATAARRGIAAVRDELNGQLSGLADQIERKEAKELPETLNELETALATKEVDIDELEENIEQAEEAREEAREILDQSEERQDELAQLESEIEEIRVSIESSENERTECTEQIAELTEQRADLEKRIDQLHQELQIEEREGDAVEATLESRHTEDDELRDEIEAKRVELQGTASTLEQAEERATELRERAEELEAQAAKRDEEINEDVTALEERQSDVGELRARRDALADSFEDAEFGPDEVDDRVDTAESKLSELRERESDLRAKIDAVQDDIKEAETLIEAGKCPTCGQDVHEAAPVERLQDDRERLRDLEASLEYAKSDRSDLEERRQELGELLEDARELDRLEERIENAEELIADKTAAIESRRENLESLREEATTAEEAAAEKREDAAQARDSLETIRSQIAELNAQRQVLKDRIADVEDLQGLYDQKDELGSELERLRDRRDSIDELNDERRDRLAEKQDRRRELADAVDERRIEEARDELDRAERYLDQATGQRETLAEERDELQGRIGRVQAELDELSELRDRRGALEDRRAAISTAHSDVEELESLYGSLRSELRERNVTALEHMLNETFDLVYQNDAYDRIELDAEYRFTVYQKDGEPLSPEQLSGGERALFNLSLRCAIYRLLSEGIEGAAPLPPLILDEPTVYLDAGHVSRLVDLVDAMRELGVEQIILVTHDRELLRAADVTLTVEKDPTTNRSSVRTAPAGAIRAAQD